MLYNSVNTLFNKSTYFKLPAELFGENIKALQDDS